MTKGRKGLQSPNLAAIEMYKRIETWRKAQSPKVSQQRIADYAGISLAAYRLYQNGSEPGADVVERLATLTGISEHELLPGRRKRVPAPPLQPVGLPAESRLERDAGYASLERYLETARAARHSSWVIAQLRAYRRSDADPGDAFWPHFADGLEADERGKAVPSKAVDVGAEALERVRATGFEPAPLKPTNTQAGATTKPGEKKGRGK